MAWHLKVPRHYLNQCWLGSMLPHIVTKPQWVKLIPQWGCQAFLSPLTINLARTLPSYPGYEKHPHEEAPIMLILNTHIICQIMLKLCIQHVCHVVWNMSKGCDNTESIYKQNLSKLSSNTPNATSFHAISWTISENVMLLHKIIFEFL